MFFLGQKVKFNKKEVIIKKLSQRYNIAYVQELNLAQKFLQSYHVDLKYLKTNK